MKRHVHSYTRHQDGKLVTVNEYDAGMSHGMMKGDIRQNIVRQVISTKSYMMAAVPGVFQIMDRNFPVPSAVYSNGITQTALYPAHRAVPDSEAIKITAYMPEILLSASSDAWEEAVQQAIDHIVLVIRNNPGKEMQQILNRPDVQEALSEAGIDGAAAVIAEVTKVWNENNGPAGSPYLNSVLNDMRRNGMTFPNRMSQALLDGDRSQVEKTLLSDRLRATAAQTAAATRARTERSIANFRSQGMGRVRWVAHIDEKTCSTCIALNGTETDIGAEFNRRILILNKLRPYGNLIGPPAHPNCRCELEPVE